MTTTVRPVAEGDRRAVLALADRLRVGRPDWRDAEAWRDAVRGWVSSALERVDDHHAVFVAVRDGVLTGFVSAATRTHFTGAVDAYVGELVVDEQAEGTGVGRLLMARVESWARDRGHRIVTLETGAANLRALRFYGDLGYVAEDVRLVKLLAHGTAGPEAPS